jgi:hypothetical protein
MCLHCRRTAAITLRPRTIRLALQSLLHRTAIAPVQTDDAANSCSKQVWLAVAGVPASGSSRLMQIHSDLVHVHAETPAMQP